MPTNEYLFITQWRLPGTPEQISDLLGDTETLTRIWPSLYSWAWVLNPGDERGVGKELMVETEGHLPYTLRWAFRVTESRHPYGYSIEAWGDMVGTGVWTLESDGDGSLVTYEWRVRAEKLLLKWLSPLLRPLFKANHDRVMADGEAGLRRELELQQAGAAS